MNSTPNQPQRQYAKLGREMLRDLVIWRILLSSTANNFWWIGLVITAGFGAVASLSFWAFGALNFSTLVYSFVGAFIVTFAMFMSEQIRLWAGRIDDYIDMRARSALTHRHHLPHPDRHDNDDRDGQNQRLLLLVFS